MDTAVHSPARAAPGSASRQGSVLVHTVRWLEHCVAEPVLSVLFPPRCVVCGDFETHLCDSCCASLVPVADGSCPRCGEPGARASVQGRCAACMGREIEHDGVRSAFLHEGAAKHLVSEFKFGGQPVLGRIMAELAAPAFAAYARSLGPAEQVLVTWVPAHRRAQRERGYNQAELLARRLAEGSGLAYGPLVRKTTVTRHQKGLGRTGRQSNLRGAFDLLPDAAERVRGSRCRAVILVDDVYTTGATAAEVSRVIKGVAKAGHGPATHVFTFSRARSGKGVGHD